MTLQAIGITKTFGSFTALKNVSLTIAKGEFMALLGPSGSGKTTLLRILAGLDTQDAGEIRSDDEDVTGRSLRDRRVGFVFQHYALFKHMTVSENVAFGLKVRPAETRPSPPEITRRVNELLRLVQLEHMGTRFPSQLSGGQRQRVALARALAIEPSVLLLDEPFGALDAKVRKELRHWLRRLHDEMQLTSVFVTHDQEEALELADRVAVMSQGKIEQVGTPDDVYHRPGTAFVYEFMGNVNRFDCRIQEGQAKVGPLLVSAPEFPAARDLPGLAYVRPHDITLRAADEPGLPAVIRHVFTAGPGIRVELERRDTLTAIEANVPHDASRQLLLTPGTEVSLTFSGARVFAAG
ncbi:MAG TPA: sulfate/molybdate ABC transporter ATP-binding protein [Candidatus Binatia bacterium]|nr:sulfate/molybdate ABC transporter ATP-binding protein [Candidatus Binatia bacterium]